jgi:hypothetical protein
MTGDAGADPTRAAPVLTPGDVLPRWATPAVGGIERSDVVAEDADQVLAMAGEAGRLTEPYGLTVMGRMGADADSHRPLAAGPEVVGPLAPARGVPEPGPAAPDDITDADWGGTDMPGQQLAAGEG